MWGVCERVEQAVNIGKIPAWDKAGYHSDQAGMYLAPTVTVYE